MFLHCMCICERDCSMYGCKGKVTLTSDIYLFSNLFGDYLSFIDIFSSREACEQIAITVPKCER